MKTKLPTSHSQLTQRFYDPTNEVAFKRVFDDAERLKDFLNALLEEYLGSKIVSLEPLPTQALHLAHELRSCAFAVKVQDEAKNIYVIEMQRASDPHFTIRAQIYGAHTLINSLNKKVKAVEAYKQIAPVIVVCVSKAQLFNDLTECVTFHTSGESKTGKRKFGLLNYLCIELPKFRKQMHELTSYQDEWLFFLENSPDLHDVPETHDPLVRAAYSEMEKFNWSIEQHDAYVRAEMVMARDEERVEAGVAEGMAKGIAEGMAKGIEMGKLEGIEMGKLEEKRLIVQRMFSLGISRQIVAESVQLSEEEFVQLLENADA